MTTKILKSALAAAAVGLLAAGSAFATPALKIDGTLLTVGNGGLTYNSGTGFYNFNFATSDGWGTSGAFQDNSPILDPGLDISTLAVTCRTGLMCSTSGVLTISLSEVGFAQTVGQNGFTNYMTGGVTSGAGTASQAAYWDSTNALFGTPSTGYINTVWAGQPAQMGGGPASGIYSLTLVDTFTDTNLGNYVSFSTDAGIKAAEPGTLALFGAGLLGCALFIGRRRSLRS